jgi:hypothetical protein
MKIGKEEEIEQMLRESKLFVSMFAAGFESGRG